MPSNETPDLTPDGDRPELFRLGDPAPVSDVILPSFSTPLGPLVLGLEVEGEAIAPAAVFADGDRRVAVWRAPVRFEVLLAPAPVSLPPGMKVTAAWAAAWRMGEPDKARPAVLRCLWTSEATWTEFGPESGENLDAQTWTDGRTKVTVGLPDHEAATTYRRDGFEVAVNSVSGGQGHFVCAWAPDTPDDVSTWFAVDLPPAISSWW